jgi:hypothetical protein
VLSADIALFLPLSSRYIVGSGSLAGVKVVGLGFRSEEEGLAIPRVVDDEELDELNEGNSGLGIQ